MSRYRKVLTRTWQDERVLGLSPDAQRVYLYHLTSPFSTPFLLYLEGPGSVGDTLRLTSRKLREVQEKLTAEGIVRYAHEGSLRWVFLLKALLIEENAPAGANAVVNYVKLFRELPATQFRHDAVRHWRTLEIPHRGTIAFLDAISNACGYDKRDGSLKSSTSSSPMASLMASPMASEMTSERHASAGAVAVSGEGTGAVRGRAPLAPSEVKRSTSSTTLHDRVDELRRAERKV